MMWFIRSSCLLIMALLTSAPFVNGQSQHQVKVTPVGSGIKADPEEMVKRFSESLAEFETEYMQSKPDLLKADKKYEAFGILIKPYGRFTVSMAASGLAAMGSYVDKVLGSLQRDMGDPKVSLGDFIESCQERTEKLFPALDRRKASLFITPLVTSSPDDGWILQLIPFDDSSSIDPQYKFLDPVPEAIMAHSSIPLPGVAVRTNSQFPRIARGLYQYLIYSPRGFITSPGTVGSNKNYGTLNLVDPEAKTISCGRAAGILICQTD